MKQKILIKNIAYEIKQYLDEHPAAADNIQGITDWWLLRQRLKEHSEDVQQALLLLISDGYVSKRINEDGSEIYLSSHQELNDSD